MSEAEIITVGIQFKALLTYHCLGKLSLLLSKSVEFLQVNHLKSSLLPTPNDMNNAAYPTRDHWWIIQNSTQNPSLWSHMSKQTVNLSAEKAVALLLHVVVDNAWYFFLPDLQSVDVDVVLDVLKRPSEAIHHCRQLLKLRNQLTRLSQEYFNCEFWLVLVKDSVMLLSLRISTLLSLKFRIVYITPTVMHKCFIKFTAVSVLVGDKVLCYVSETNN